MHTFLLNFQASFPTTLPGFSITSRYYLINTMNLNHVCKYKQFKTFGVKFKAGINREE